MWKAFEFTPISALCNKWTIQVPANLSISALLHQTVIQGGVSSLILCGGGGGFKSPWYLIASPPIPLPVDGASSINFYVRSVPNRLPSLFWPLNLMEISVVLTALFAPARPAFMALRVRTLHPKSIADAPPAPLRCVFHRSHNATLAIGPVPLHTPTPQARFSVATNNPHIAAVPPTTPVAARRGLDK